MDPEAQSSEARYVPYAPYAVAAAVVAWVVWAHAFNQAQFGDNIEQFNWSHRLDWGYAKHPPLPTWLLGAAIAAFGRAPWLGYALGAACFAATGALTWAIAKRLLGGRAASVAMLLWSLQSSFSWRAQLYNHNTVMVLAVAATVWCALRATDPQTDGRPRWWIGAGIAAGCALLAKYQALLPFGALLFALAWTGRLRDRRAVRGIALAATVAVALFAPHAAWVATHDFTTLRYAATSVQEATSGNAVRAALSFFVNQLRMLLPVFAALLIHGLLGVVARRRRGAAAPVASIDAGAADPDAGRWLFALVWAPAIVLLVLAAFGVRLRNHWGVQTFQFVAPWIAWRWQRRGGADLRRLAVVVAVVHLAMFALYAVQHRPSRAAGDARRIDTLYPADALARAVAAAWRAETACPLRYVAGDGFLAGLAALYGREGAAVYDGPATPWVDAAAFAQAGHVAVVDRRDALPAGTTRVAAVAIVGHGDGGRVAYIGVVPPHALGCPTPPRGRDR